MPWKHPQVLGLDLNRSESSEKADLYGHERPEGIMCVFASALGDDDAYVFERAADPLHRARINSKLFGNDADTESPISRLGGGGDSERRVLCANIMGVTSRSLNPKRM
jgi:hypothetical protein